MSARAPRAGRLVAVLALVLAPLLALAPAAAAAEPFALPSQVTDEVGAFAGEEAAVQESLDELADRAGIVLFVVAVDDFSGRDGQAWAQETGELSNLGSSNAVFAVATTERSYGTAASVDTDAANAAALDRLREEDWAGAVQAFADTLGDTATGTAGGTDGAASGGSSGSGPSPLGVLVVLLLLAVAVAVVVSLVRSRRRAATADGTGRPTGPGRGGRRTPPPEPLPDLERRAGSALVAVDDAVMSSATEVDFARAEFGDEAVVPFERALAGAREDLAEAFAARRRADGEGGTPPDEATRRAALAEVLERCGRADAALDEQSDAFDALRDLGRRAGEVLAAREADLPVLRGRLDEERTRLVRLAERYADSARENVAQAPEQAAASLDLLEDEV